MVIKVIQFGISTRFQSVISPSPRFGELSSQVTLTKC